MNKTDQVTDAGIRIANVVEGPGGPDALGGAWQGKLTPRIHRMRRPGLRELIVVGRTAGR